MLMIEFLSDFECDFELLRSGHPATEGKPRACNESVCVHIMGAEGLSGSRFVDQINIQ
jgi:hypothetical protein